MLVCYSSMCEGVITCRPPQDAIIIEDAAPHKAGSSAAVLLDGGEESDAGEGSREVLEGSYALEQDGVEFVDVAPVELGEVVSVVDFCRSLISQQRGKDLWGDGKAM